MARVRNPGSQDVRLGSIAVSLGSCTGVSWEAVCCSGIEKGVCVGMAGGARGGVFSVFGGK